LKGTRKLTSSTLGTLAGSIVEANEIYRLYFHGPAYQVVEKAWWDGKRIVGLFANGLPENHRPSDLSTLVAPRLIELCFQTAGLWEMGIQGRMGLPLHIRQVNLFNAPEPVEGRLYAVVTPNPKQETFDADVVDTKGSLYLRLCGYLTVALPNSIGAEPLKALQEAMTLKTVTV
jgi:hypothetical protein